MKNENIIKINILSIISTHSRIYNIEAEDEIKLNDILEFNNNKYKVTRIHTRFGIFAYKILSNSISKSNYININIDNNISILSEKTTKGTK